MSWEGLAGDRLSCQFSPLESSRFGRSIARLTVGWEADETAASTYARRCLDEREESLIIARWPTHMLAVMSHASLSKRRLLAADVLTYWESTPEAILARTGEPPNGTQVAPLLVGAAASGVVEGVVRDSFDSYGNHYFANPDLSPTAALAGYVEWACSSLTDTTKDVLVLYQDGQAAGLATTSHSIDGRDLEVELAGLRRDFQNRGLYSHLLHAVAEHANAGSHRRVIISTQVHNVRVQRAWVRFGFSPFAAFTTSHATSR